MKDILRVITVIVAMLLRLALSWAIIAVFTYAICFCFGWEYSRLKAIGVWLIYILVKDAVAVVAVENYRKNNI